MSAVAAILALAAAVAAAIYVRRQYGAMKDQGEVMSSQLELMREQAAGDREVIDRQRAEWAEADRVRMRAQADLVDLLPELRLAEIPNIEAGTYWMATVANTSNRAIRNVRCRANVEGADKPNQVMNDHVGHIKEVGNTGPRFVKDADLRVPLPVLRRGESVTFLLSLHPSPAWLTKFWVQFEDDADLYWQLDSHGRLRRIELDERWTY